MGTPGATTYEHDQACPQSHQEALRSGTMHGTLMRTAWRTGGTVDMDATSAHAMRAIARTPGGANRPISA
jgi:hypothetical protein